MVVVNFIANLFDKSILFQLCHSPALVKCEESVEVKADVGFIFEGVFDYFMQSEEYVFDIECLFECVYKIEGK